MVDSKVYKWMQSGKYLPQFMRDFHDQKDLFKLIYYVFNDDTNKDRVPDWITSHCFVIDWFLWFMASRGYTLQKTRTKLDFPEEIFSIGEYKKKYESE